MLIEGGRMEVRAWGGGVVSSRQLGLGLAVLNEQQPGWWITPALSWVNGHRHPSLFNNVSACIVIEMSPKMEVNMQLSHLIWEATFLPQAADLKDPCKRSFLNRCDIIFTEMTCRPIPILSESQKQCWKTRQSSHSSIQSGIIASKEAHIVFMHICYLVVVCSAVMSGVTPQLRLGMWVCQLWHQGSSLPNLIWMKHFKTCW